MAKATKSRSSRSSGRDAMPGPDVRRARGDLCEACGWAPGVLYAPGELTWVCPACWREKDAERKRKTNGTETIPEGGGGSRT